MSVCDWPIVSNVCDVAGEAAATVAAFPFELIASAMGGAAEWLFEAVWDAFDATTLVDVTRPEYVAVYNIIFGIAVSLMLLFFCLQLITGLVKRDPTALSRAVLGLAKSVLGSFVVITLVALALEITDQLCIGIIQAAGETVDSMGGKISILVAGLGGITMAAPGVGAVLIIFLAGLAIAAAAIVWLSLLVRKALLLVAIALAPLAFSGSSWDAAKGWISKWAMFVLALVLSKLVLVIIFLVAITQVSAPISTDLTSVSDPLAGIVLMALAGFSPYLVYRFLSFVGVDLYNQIGAEQEAKSAVNRPVPIPTKPAGDGPKKVLDTNTGDKPTSSPPPSNPSSSGPASSAAPAATATAGEGTAATGGAATGGAAVAAPVAAVVVAKEAATAGPKAGTALAAQGEQAADAANQSTSTPPPPNAPAPASSTPSAPAGAPRGSEPPPPPPPPVPKTPPGKE
ncbi:conjugal transfer protein TrbL [Schaalia sp. JY-X159]|uniref:conjugal transfer protein TrbL n=1 Tax=Schaalia sp. JY-X159 TaxID=2758575 RepID=UPI00165DC987|nr:conjugal transfer protein TrbL [Schaalia sp. JY-X159]